MNMQANATSPATPQIEDETSPGVKKFGYFFGPLLFLLTFAFDAPEGMNLQAWHVCGLAMWMATWWISEAMPLPVSSLLPIIFLPTVIDMPFREAISAYASPIIFLFLGGFIISQGMEKHKLHLRIGLGLLKMVGVGGKSILAGMMLACAFLGMWMSNTATVIMMLPMAVSIAYLLTHREGEEDLPLHKNDFAKAMALGVAYAGVIGGLGTFVGTPTNAILQGYLSKTYGYTLKLSEWMQFGVPLVILLIGLAWVVLNHMYIRHSNVREDVREVVREEFGKLGTMSFEEKAIAFVFGTVAICWVFSDLIADVGSALLDKNFQLPDAVIAIAGALALFLIPTNKRMDHFVMDWKDTVKVPWGILLFFGGSLAISGALTSTGVSEWMSGELKLLDGVSMIVLITAVVILIILASELLSNVATVTAFLPILSALAVSIDVHPMLILIPATLAASCGFMLPGASAPNALAYSTGYLRVKDMVKTGAVLDTIAGILVIIFSLLIVNSVMDYEGHDFTLPPIEQVAE